jgi:predicted MPP superfamily phosphohydrolase
METMSKSPRKKSGKFLRAQLRHSIFTKGADRILGGRLTKAHAEQPVVAREVDVPLSDWPKAWSGLRIGQITDMHFGDLMPVEKGIAAIELLGKQKPDIVVFTGDMIDLKYEGAQPLFDALSGIHAPLGAFMVMGNHDYLDDGDAVRRMAESAGIRVLDEATAVFFRSKMDLPGVGDGSDGELRIAGIDWDRTVKALGSRVEKIAGFKPHLLLAHNPKAFLPASREGIPLTLAGHTHGGQVATSKKPGVNLAVAHRLSAGLYRREDSALFVSVGVGAWFPLRVHCPAEVVVLIPRAASRSME